MDTKYLLGHPEIDAHHATLIATLEELHRQVGLNEVSFDSIRKIHEFLVNYATTHFGLEHSLMERASYPNLQQHCSKHVWFLGRVSSAFDNSLTTNVLAQALDTLLALNSWLLNHIQKDDAELVAFLLSKNSNGHIQDTPS